MKGSAHSWMHEAHRTVSRWTIFSAPSATQLLHWFCTPALPQTRAPLATLVVSVGALARLSTRNQRRFHAPNHYEFHHCLRPRTRTRLRRPDSHGPDEAGVRVYLDRT